jgi:hypothetical protein
MQEDSIGNWNRISWISVVLAGVEAGRNHSTGDEPIRQYQFRVICHPFSLLQNARRAENG